MNAEILELKTEVSQMRKEIHALKAALLLSRPVDESIPTEEEARMAMRDNDFGPALLMIRARKGGHNG